MTLLFVSYTFCSLFMLGLIWFVQILHYPLLKYVGEDAFSNYHHQHLRLAGYLIAPVMVIELLACLLILSKSSHYQSVDFRIQLFFLGLIWFSTFFIQVPLHKKLTKAWNLQLIDRLAKSNWVRTIFWTIKAILILLPSLPLSGRIV